MGGLAQNKETIISGRVTSAEDASPLEGATLLVKGTKNLTGTMPDGAFSLPVAPNDTVVIVSLMGYETKEIKVTKEPFYEIVLWPASSKNNQIKKDLFISSQLVTVNR